jgi:Peptidase family M23
MKKLIILLWGILCHVQHNYPQDLFIPPLQIPLIPAGTFGELRSGHFHSGLDIKTQQIEGLPVYVIGDGMVSRIKIAHWGYGKALYIVHPNGYTSVYGHLQKFSPKIEAYVKNKQYEKESYEIELFPNSSELIIQKGEIIAYSGDTGSSSGPHLHFEIRNTNSEKPINPMLLGMEIKDNQPPFIDELYVYALSDSTQINQSNIKLKINLNKQKDGTFSTDTLYAEGKIGFGINAYDKQDFSLNKNGVYAVEMMVNGVPYLSYDFETFSFNESHYINTFIDYEHYAKFGERIQQCFIFPYNKLYITIT